jgi:hypothetical protein
VLERPHDGNWVRGTNVALQHARGDYVSFLHQDDAWMSGRLAAARAAVAGHDLLLHGTAFIDAAGRPLGRWTCPLPAGEVPVRVLQERLAIQNCVGLPSTLFRRELALAAGPLDETLWFTADWDLWTRLAARGASVVHLPETLAESRVHRRAQTSTRTADVDEVRRQVQQVQARGLEVLGRPAGLVRAAAFNAEVTAALAALSHGRLRAGAMIRAALRVRPADWPVFVRAARVGQRAIPRLRARWRAAD